MVKYTIELQCDQGDAQELLAMIKAAARAQQYPVWMGIETVAAFGSPGDTAPQQQELFEAMVAAHGDGTQPPGARLPFTPNKSHDSPEARQVLAAVAAAERD